MNSEALFSMALGLQPPWQVQEITFAPNESGREELNIMIGFPPGSRFADSNSHFDEVTRFPASGVAVS